MRSADVIREARLRAGLTQQELADRSGRKRGVIAHWEQGTVAPSAETLIELVRALQVRSAARARSARARRRRPVAEELASHPRTARPAAPERPGRTRRHRVNEQRFDPYATLEALQGRGVTYVLIGGFARVIQGTEEVTHGLDLAPSLHGDNLERLALALADLESVSANGGPLAIELATARSEPMIELRTSGGEVKIVPEPAGTRGGYNDLRRAANHQALGRGLRPLVASIGDLSRLAAALGREQDITPLRQLRILADLDHARGRGIER